MKDREDVSPVDGEYDIRAVISRGYLYTENGSRLDIRDEGLTLDHKLRTTDYPLYGASVVVERKNKASYILCKGSNDTFVATNYVPQDRLLRELDRNMYDKIVDNIDEIKKFLELLKG